MQKVATEKVCLDKTAKHMAIMHGSLCFSQTLTCFLWSSLISSCGFEVWKVKDSSDFTILLLFQKKNQSVLE